jgi:isoquinoline 1-oxidoreductase beta subunit
VSADGPRRPSRRAALAGAGGLIIGFTLLKGAAARAQAAAPPPPNENTGTVGAFAPNAFIRIDPQGPIRLVMPNVEMGQGSYTGEATLLAEELDVGLDQIVVEHAPPNNALYSNPLLGFQATGGSTSMRSGWKGLRQAGAAARAMLVAEAAQRWSVDPATLTVDRGVVRHDASGRTAPYASLAAGAGKRPVPEHPTLKTPAQFKIIGRPVKRVDTPQKVDGSTVYGIDAQVPGMKFATLAICPSFGGTVKSLDEAAAMAVPGVLQVVRLDGAVAVIGEHFWAAKQGLEALKVDWAPGPGAGFTTAKLVAALDHASTHGKPVSMRKVGDLSKGGKSIAAVYQAPMLAHATMEPLNATVQVRPDACEIWVGTQVPTRCVDEAVKVTGLRPEQVTVHNHYLGGGFGRKLDADYVNLAVRIAKAVPYPVKVVWSREQDIQHDIPRPYYFDRISAKVDGDGYPVVWTDRVTSDSVLRRWVPQAFAASGDGDVTEGSAEPPYDLPNLQAEWVRYDMPDDLPIGWWRGVGPTHNLFKVESFVDELAHAAGKDPVAYRRALLKKNPRALGVLNLAADKMGWSSPLASARRGRGVALGSPFGSHVCAMVEVEVSLQGDIRILRSVTTVDCGVAINPNTVEAQIQGGLVFGWTAALYGQLTYEDGAVQQSNFNDYRMMRINETPPLEVHVVKSGESPGGIGEVGTAIAAPALGNAVFAATGVRIRTLPIDRTLLIQDKASGKQVISGLPLAALGLAASALAAEAPLPEPGPARRAGGAS